MKEKHLKLCLKIAGWLAGRVVGWWPVDSCWFELMALASGHTKRNISKWHFLTVEWVLAVVLLPPHLIHTPSPTYPQNRNNSLWPIEVEVVIISTRKQLVCHSVRQWRISRPSPLNSHPLPHALKHRHFCWMQYDDCRGLVSECLLFIYLILLFFLLSFNFRRFVCNLRTQPFGNEFSSFWELNEICFVFMKVIPRNSLC